MDPKFARQYYESASSHHWWFRGRRELVGQLLGRASITSGDFVDLGAGSETLLPTAFSVVKLDIVRPEKVPDKFVQASAEHLPFASGSFDGVGLFDVLEHLPDPARCLAEVRRIVRPGGLVLVTVPAHQWLWSPHDDLVGHERRYSRDALERALRGAGLAVEWISGFYGFLLGAAIVRAALSLQSPMSLPRDSVNERLAALARRSAASAVRRPTGLGLSLGALAFVP